MVMYHDFDKACFYGERCRKGTQVVVSGKRADSRSGGRVGTATKTTARDSMKVADTSNNNDNIVTTVSTSQYSARGRDWARVKAKGK